MPENKTPAALGDVSDMQQLASDLIGKMKSAGADAADLLLVSGTSVSVSCRLGEIEDVERSEGQDLGLRAFIGNQQAVVSTSDLSAATLDEMVARVVAMAKSAPADPFCGLAASELLADDIADLDIFDATAPDMPELIAAARQCEDAARAIDGITNSEGAGTGWGHSQVVLATSTGFNQGYKSSSYSISCSVLAGEGVAMERDYEFSSSRHHADLTAAEEIGKIAAYRTLSRLNPRKVKSTQVPVVYAPRVANSLLGHLAGAINGAAVARGTSFLKDCLGQKILPDQISVIDDPHRLRGLRSKPFDGEGVRNSRSAMVENGVLQGWFLDSAAARQLGLQSSGHAARGTGGAPGPAPTNLYMTPGVVTPDALLADIKEGLLITELIGMGVNGVTGDYSRGASGFWIENGKPAYPVSEVTVAGNLREMFMNITAADDLQFHYGTNAPTLRVEGMMVAGE